MCCQTASQHWSDFSNSPPSPPGPGSLKEGPGQLRHAAGLAVLRAPTPVCPAGLITSSACQRGERRGCQRTHTTQHRGHAGCRLTALNSRERNYLWWRTEERTGWEDQRSLALTPQGRSVRLKAVCICAKMNWIIDLTNSGFLRSWKYWKTCFPCLDIIWKMKKYP